jgi:hypothetical protein
MADVRGTGTPTKLVLSRGLCRTGDCQLDGQSQYATDTARQELGLIEPALSLPRGVNRDRDKEVPTDAGPPPTRCHQRRERLDQASLAVVLESVQAGTRRAGICSAPLELHNPRRPAVGQADRHAGRLVEPPLEVARAAATYDLSLAAAAGACRG